MKYKVVDLGIWEKAVRGDHGDICLVNQKGKWRETVSDEGTTRIGRSANQMNKDAAFIAHCLNTNQTLIDALKGLVYSRLSHVFPDGSEHLTVDKDAMQAAIEALDEAEQVEVTK